MYLIYIRYGSTDRRDSAAPVWPGGGTGRSLGDHPGHRPRAGLRRPRGRRLPPAADLRRRHEAGPAARAVRGDHLRAVPGRRPAPAAGAEQGPVPRRVLPRDRPQHDRPRHHRAGVPQVRPVPHDPVRLHPGEQPVRDHPADPVPDVRPPGRALRAGRDRLVGLQHGRDPAARVLRLPAGLDVAAGRAVVGADHSHPDRVPLEHPPAARHAVAATVRQHVRRPPAAAGVHPRRRLHAASSPTRSC